MVKKNWATKDPFSVLLKGAEESDWSARIGRARVWEKLDAHDLVRAKEPVLDRLLDAHASALLLLEASEGEGEDASLDKSKSCP